VLDSLLPGVRRRLELSLIDDGLAETAARMPAGENRSATSLIAFLASCLPGISLRPCQVPQEMAWDTLSRKRAFRIANQVFDKDHQQLFDPESDDDLSMIESMDRTILADIWTAIENVFPLTNTPNISVRVRSMIDVDLDRRTATLDGKPYEVTSTQALRWVKVLAEHAGKWISGTELAEYDEELDGVRTDKLRPHLPAKISALIDSKPGGGSRIRFGVTMP
jgi:hypothetical protein